MVGIYKSATSIEQGNFAWLINDLIIYIYEKLLGTPEVL